MTRIRKIGAMLAAGASLFALATYASIQPVDTPFTAVISDTQKLQVTDRNGAPLSISYKNPWNSYDLVALHDMPDLLVQAFLLSEDKRFYEHHGVDWSARASALWQDAKHLRRQRGASTISEQVVRLLHPRSRNLWSKWIEGFEATGLEQHFSKADILEFYLNQLPYAANRRGVLQASRYYFSRDLGTLSKKEMLALVVLARAPSGYDLYKRAKDIDGSINRLAEAMQLSETDLRKIKGETLMLAQPAAPVNAAHFVQYVRLSTPASVQEEAHNLHTTLDAHLQRRAQELLDQRIKTLSAKHVRNGAVLVADHTTGEILAWVIGGADDEKTPGRMIDAVTVPRQPGSALKPFLYTLALDSGWTPVTIIEDAPLNEAIGNGLHRFNNYSHLFYGKVTLRQALGNSLNIPALHTIDYVGVERYLDKLRALGFASLNKDARLYDEGLALGDGEVMLLELVQGYAALAHRGVYRPLSFLTEGSFGSERRVYSEEATSLIGNILSDPWARNMEFGSGSVLNLPVQTAVKTGTSTDYRDAWAVGFNDRYVVGVWMGNLDQSPMDGVTGSTGPALALRGVFNELNANRTTHRLFSSPKLVQQDVCVPLAGGDGCVNRSEYFMQGSEPSAQQATAPARGITLTQPTDGLHLAIDPRVPRDKQAFEFALAGVENTTQVEWVLDNESIAKQKGGKYLWQLARGKHQLKAVVWQDGRQFAQTVPVEFIVK